MENERKSVAASDGDSPIQASLRKQLAAIEREETPERLLVLARELQRLVRDTSS